MLQTIKLQKMNTHYGPPRLMAIIMVCLSCSRLRCSFFLFSDGGLASETSISSFPIF